VAARTPGDDLRHLIAEAQSPGWSVGVGRANEVMATRDTGEVGRPWVVLARRASQRLHVSLYRPGDDVGAEGEDLATLEGTPRQLGRQLRLVLEGLGDVTA
jgi:hypothetical protein